MRIKFIAPVFAGAVAGVLMLPQAAGAHTYEIPSSTAVAVSATVRSGDTAWGIAAARCGSGYLHTRLTIRSPQGVSRNHNWIYPGDSVRGTCTGTAVPAPRVSPSSSGWVAPLSGALVCSSRWWDWRPGGRHHMGIDLPRSSGTPIRSVHSGTVRLNKWSYLGGWGITIDHGGGYLTAYRHLRFRPNLRVGTKVRAGQQIGVVGATGASVHGAHLHFEVLHGLGYPINPAPFLRSHGVKVGC